MGLRPSPVRRMGERACERRRPDEGSFPLFNSRPCVGDPVSSCPEVIRASFVAATKEDTRVEPAHDEVGAVCRVSPFAVTPAKAGVQLSLRLQSGMPACAGKTEEGEIILTQRIVWWHDDVRY